MDLRFLLVCIGGGVVIVLRIVAALVWFIPGGINILLDEAAFEVVNRLRRSWQVLQLLELFSCICVALPVTYGLYRLMSGRGLPHFSWFLYVSIVVFTIFAWHLYINAGREWRRPTRVR